MEIQRWKEILSPYDLAVKELDVKFNHMIMENRNIGRYSYVERVETRRKTIASIIEKCKRKSIPVESAVDVLTDIAGIRLICQFEEDIERVADEIRKRPDMVVLEEKNYLQDVKENTSARMKENTGIIIQPQDQLSIVVSMRSILSMVPALYLSRSR